MTEGVVAGILLESLRLLRRWKKRMEKDKWYFACVKPGGKVILLEGDSPEELPSDAKCEFKLLFKSGEYKPEDLMAIARTKSKVFCRIRKVGKAYNAECYVVKGMRAHKRMELLYNDIRDYLFTGCFEYIGRKLCGAVALRKLEKMVREFTDQTFEELPTIRIFESDIAGRKRGRRPEIIPPLLAFKEEVTEKAPEEVVIVEEEETIPEVKEEAIEEEQPIEEEVAEETMREEIPPEVARRIARLKAIKRRREKELERLKKRAMKKKEEESYIEKLELSPEYLED